tara:strand:+ start:809 stop:1309 length:501 start_codon:yes stop_codon:yes gene_type:complete
VRGWPFYAENSVVIDAPKSVVWKSISSPGNLNDSHPFCQENTVQNWPGEESVDTLEYLNGFIIVRKFQSWNEGEGYSLLTGREGGRQSFVEWSLSEVNEKRTLLKIRVHPHLLSNWNRITASLAYLFYIRPKLKKYLYSVTRGFEWHIKNRKKIPRNHFGEHPWFS